MLRLIEVPLALGPSISSLALFSLTVRNDLFCGSGPQRMSREIAYSPMAVFVALLMSLAPQRHVHQGSAILTMTQQGTTQEFCVSVLGMRNIVPPWLPT